MPEFEAVVFSGTGLGVLPALVSTGYGFHIVVVDARIAGRQLPYDAVRETIAVHLSARVQQKALRQYVAVLAGQAGIRDMDLGAVGTPLVQ